MIWDCMAIIGIGTVFLLALFARDIACKLLGSVAILAIIASGSTASAQHGVCHVPAATYHPPAQQVIHGHGHGHGYGHGYYLPPFPLVAFYPYADRAYSAPPTAAQVQATDDLKELRTAMTEQAKALAALADAVTKLKVK